MKDAASRPSPEKARERASEAAERLRAAETAQRVEARLATERVEAPPEAGEALPGSRQLPAEVDQQCFYISSRFEFERIFFLTVYLIF